MIKKILLTLWGILLVSAAYYFYSRGISIDELQSYFQNLGAMGAVAYIIAYTIRPLVFFPTSIMTPLSAVLFGPYLAWIFTYIGETLSASFAFFIARYFGRNYVKEHENKFLRKYDEQLNSYGFETVVFLRLVPLFPFDFVNYACGLSGIKFRDYLYATLIGIIPGLTAYIFLGGSLADPRLLVPTILMFMLLSYMAKKLKNKNKK